MKMDDADVSMIMLWVDERKKELKRNRTQLSKHMPEKERELKRQQVKGRQMELDHIRHLTHQWGIQEDLERMQNDR